MISFKDVKKQFGTHVVLDGFTLDVHDGETMIILGYSGTGKSVALKHIVGLLEPDEGHVEVDGQIGDRLDRDGVTESRWGVGYGLNLARLCDSMPVGGSLALGLKRRRLSTADIQGRVAASLSLVDMEGTEDRFPAELSGGMRKRVGIARAIALRPRYILYDEPTTGLDPVTSAVINQLMIKTREKLGVTGIVVTHDLESAYVVGDRIAMLYHGQIRQVGPVEQVRRTHDPVVRQFLDGRPEAAAEADTATFRAIQ